MQTNDLGAIRATLNAHLDSLRAPNAPYGHYQMKQGGRVELYAATDAAISRTVMGENLQQSLSPADRQAWISHINSFAQPDGTYTDLPESAGLWHSPEHRNGMVIGALGPLGGRQPRPVSLYDRFDTAAKIGPWLESVNWCQFWTGSHVFWGGMHCFSLSARCTQAWQAAAFAWLDANLDPVSGWWRKGVLHDGNAERQELEGLGGGCHIWPIYQHLGRAFPCPTQVIDSILNMQKPDGSWLNFGNYMELDALYGLKYMGSLAPQHRRGDIAQAVERHGRLVAERWPAFLAGNPNQHMILALCGAFGLLQQHAPDTWRDSNTWSDIFSDPKLYQTRAVETL